MANNDSHFLPLAFSQFRVIERVCDACHANVAFSCIMDDGSDSDDDNNGGGGSGSDDENNDDQGSSDVDTHSTSNGNGHVRGNVYGCATRGWFRCALCPMVDFCAGCHATHEHACEPRPNHPTDRFCCLCHPQDMCRICGAQGCTDSLCASCAADDGSRSEEEDIEQD